MFLSLYYTQVGDLICTAHKRQSRLPDNVKIKSGFDFDYLSVYVILLRENVLNRINIIHIISSTSLLPQILLNMSEVRQRNRQKNTVFC